MFLSCLVFLWLSSTLEAQYIPGIVGGVNAEIESAPGQISLPDYILGRIVGGVNTKIESAPWQISLQYGGKHICGGSIYNEEIVITAAHCVENVKAEELQIRAGSTKHDEGGIVLPVYRVIQHESYAKSHINDIAIIQLAGSLNFGSKIKPIALATETPKAKKIATVTGWGRTGFMKKIPQNLQTVNLHIKSTRKCKLTFGPAFKKNMICAYDVFKSACMGDSGGPLVINGELVGIVSYGFIFCHGPTVFTDVASLNDWILKTIDEITSGKSTEISAINTEK